MCSGHSRDSDRRGQRPCAYALQTRLGSHRPDGGDVRVVVQGWSKEDALSEMTQGGFGDSTHFKDGIRYMMQADVDKLRTALANGECSTSPFAMCSMKSWFNSAHIE